VSSIVVEILYLPTDSSVFKDGDDVASLSKNDKIIIAQLLLRLATSIFDDTRVYIKNTR